MTTPDELPADMEGRLAEVADWLHPSGTEECRYTSVRIGTDLRALLKAYQERGRALEAASPVVPVGREEIEDIIEQCVFADDATEFTGVLQGIPEAADAILATLRPTDTGRE